MKTLRFIGFAILVFVGEMALAAVKLLPVVPTGWLSDYEKALEIAEREKKDVLIVFSGLSWCPSSKKLNAQILSQKKFIDEVGKTYVLVMIDLLSKRDKRADGVWLQNRELSDEFHADVPGIVITDARGREKKIYSGFPKGTVSEYIDRLRSDYGLVSFCSQKDFTPEMVNVTNEFARCMPLFRQVFGYQVDGFDFGKNYKVELISESETTKKFKDRTTYVVGQVGAAEVRKIVSRIAIDAYGHGTTPNHEELANYFAQRLIAKDASPGSKLFGVWDQLELNSKIVMRNYFEARWIVPKMFRKEGKKVSLNEEACFLSCASGKDAFDAYARAGIKVSQKKCIFGNGGGLRSRMELRVPHGWTEEEVENL